MLDGSYVLDSSTPELYPMPLKLLKLAILMLER